MRSEGARPHVAVVGAGFSGTLAAIELRRLGCRVSLIERGGRFAAGAAYGTDEPWHLLNVPARNMSAFPDRPDHFARWHGDPDGFAPRRAYRDYLAGLLAEAAPERVQGEARDLREVEDKVRVTVDGREIECDAAILASGNLPPLAPPMLAALGPDRFVADPWGPGGAEAVARLAGEGGDVLLLGTGLTAVDMALSLAERGFGGRTILLSRRGLLPRAHAPFAPAPLASPPRGGLVALVGAVRARAGEVGWRAAVDSLRPHSAALWRRLNASERSAFLRHLRPWWDVHRHRIAPQVAQRLAAIGPEVMAGRLAGADPAAEGVVARIAPRGGGPTVDRALAAIVNCTGPAGDIAATTDPLISLLFDSGLARPDPLGLGIEVDGQCRVAGARRLWAVGPLTKGAFWEMVAVPDIRGQVREVAARIASG